MKITERLESLNKAISKIERTYEKNTDKFLKETEEQARYVLAQITASLEQLTSEDVNRIEVAKDLTKALNSSDHLLDLEFDYNKSDRMFKDYLGGE